MGSVVIYEVQENLYYKLSLKRYNNAPLFQLLFRWFDRAARYTFRLVITEAAYRTTYAETRYPPVLIRNFASIALLDRLAEAKQPALTTPGPVLYYSGVISMERAFDTLVRAVVLLLPEFPTLQVHLFGTLRMTVAEREQLPDYDRVRSHLVFYGYTTQEVMLPYAKYALAGIALLKPVGDYPDSYPTKLFDYMALGLPVITSDFPLYKEVVETHDCGFCIDPTDAEALAGAVRRLVREESLARRMGQNGRAAAVEHYHWEQEARRLSELYAICLGKA
jgi:glycosyltransferase involved in cell wall biosynthesis